MTIKTISLFHLKRAQALAASVVICLSLAPNTLVGAANTASDERSGIVTPLLVHENGEVLGHEDAALYRVIFEEQARTRFAEADILIARLGDKQLLGHVLADRYQRRSATLDELKNWLAAYNDLPEADDLYQKAQKLPGSKTTDLVRPVDVNAMSGRDFGYGTTSGFRSREHSVAARHIARRIEGVLRQGDPATAKTILEAVLQQAALSQDDRISLQAQLAAGFLYYGDADEARRLTDISYMQGDARALWINGLSNFKLGNRAAAATAFVALANRDDLADGDHAAAAFWAYRALKRAGDKNEASRWLAEAASTPRSFYGLLAGVLTGQSAEAAWSWRLPEFDKRAADLLAGHPAGKRALALVQIGQNDLAESELRRLNPQGRRALQEAMLALTEKGHMASLALTLGGMAVNDMGRPYDAALYPVPPWQPSGGFRVERALIYALMRHESQFDPLAVSNRGACGLMQLMPATAERMNGMRRQHVGGECPDQLFDPVTNLGLGQRYVRQLAGQPRIGDNLLLLLAAYNGGPGRLSQRTDTGAGADPLLFIESLPAQETHDYVQQVMIQYWSYRARLRQPLKSLDQLARGQWPHFALYDVEPSREASIAAPVAAFALASNATVH